MGTLLEYINLVIDHDILLHVRCVAPFPDFHKWQVGVVVHCQHVESIGINYAIISIQGGKALAGGCYELRGHPSYGFGFQLDTTPADCARYTTSSITVNSFDYSLSFFCPLTGRYSRWCHCYWSWVSPTTWSCWEENLSTVRRLPMGRQSWDRYWYLGNLH